MNKNQSGTKVTSDYDKQLEKLNEGLTNQTVSYESYLRKRKKLDEDYVINKDKADLTDDQAELDRLKKHGEEIAQSKKDAEKGVTTAKGNEDPEEVIKKQEELNAILLLEKNSNKAIADADKKAADDKKKLEEDTAKKILEAKKKLHDKERELEKAAFDLAKEMVDNKYENEKNQIQSQMERNNEMFDNELKNIQRSSLSNQQKAAQEITINAQKTQSEKAARKQQHDADIAKAKFDREMAEASVIWNTAKAVMKDLSDSPPPLSYVLAAADIALGAVQLASIASKPLPAYAEGTDNHPGGYAMVGEGKYAEWVQTPSRGFIVDKPTILDLPATTSVTPINNSTINEIVLSNMEKSNSVYENKQQSVNQWEIARWQTQQITKALNKSQPVNVRNTVVIDGREQEWINKKILGK